ncbi:MAG TPA: HIT family protein [Planctomycetota bacterium]|nr:HIT family protein [Planctomycetota bacterium]
MSDPNCIFCKILAGQIPSERVYEDEQAVAFLDINPVAPGHTLLVPRAHHANLLETPHEVLSALLAAAPRVARAVMEATGAEGFNFVQFNGACSGQVVFHLHFHIIPRRPGDGVSFAWRQAKYEPGRMAALGARVRAALQAQEQ